MNPFNQIREKLKKYPELKTEEKDGYICVFAPNQDGFDVWFSEDDREYTVGFSSWHEHFEKDELDDALNCFAWGLSDKCRLKVFKRSGAEYKWMVQSLEGNSWIDYSVTSLFNFSFWKRKEIDYKSNQLIKF